MCQYAYADGVALRCRYGDMDGHEDTIHPGAGRDSFPDPANPSRLLGTAFVGEKRDLFHARHYIDGRISVAQQMEL